MDDFIGLLLIYEMINGKRYEGILKEVRQDTHMLVVEDAITHSVAQISVSEIINVQLSDSKTAYVEEPKKDPLFIHRKAMYEILETCFSSCYPTEEQFDYIVSYNINKILTTVFRANQDDRVLIVVGKDDLFGRLGLFLAMFLGNTKLKVDVYVCDEMTSPLTVAVLQRFKNAGLRTLDAIGSAYKVVAIASRNSVLTRNVLEHVYSEFYLYLDLPEISVDATNVNVGLIYGVKDDRISLFSGRVVCIDVGIPDRVMNGYGIKRLYPNSQFYAKKGVENKK